MSVDRTDPTTLSPDLVARLQGPIHSLARSLTPYGQENACLGTADRVSEAWLKVCEARRRYPALSGPDLENLLIRCVRNHLVNINKREERRRAESIEGVNPPAPEDATVEVRILIHHLRSRLPQAQWIVLDAVLWTVLIEGRRLSQRTLGSHLACSQKTAGKRLAQLRGHLLAIDIS